MSKNLPLNDLIVNNFTTNAQLRRCRERRASVRLFLKLFLLFFIFGSLVFVPPFLMAQNPAESAIQSVPTLNLDEALKALGGTETTEFRWDPFFRTGAFISGGHEASFSSGRIGETGTVLLDHREVINIPLPFLDKGDLRFPDVFITQVKNTFSRYAEEDRSRFRIAAVIIDPGHGGKDPGTSWSYTIGGKTVKFDEKDITLKVSRQLYASLTAAYPDKRVLLTRTGDTNPSKEDRVALANTVPLAGNEAAIYISVHVNASFNRDARGYEIWYLSPSYRREVIDRSKYTDSREVLPILNSMLEEELTTESIMIAQAILKRLEESVGKQISSRGLKAEEWFVVRNARMPSVLVELGFVTNETDALLMNDDAYLMNLSEALYKGISDFIAFFERSGGFAALQ